MEPRNIKAILFDKDGTLLKYEETWAPINRMAAMTAAGGDEELALSLLVATGYDPETKMVQVGSVLGAGNSEEIAQAWLGAGVKLPVRALTQILDRIFSDAMRNAVPIGKLGEVIHALHRHGYQLGIASSDSEQSIKVFLDNLNLTPFFSYVAGYDSGYGHKPEPGMLEGFCRNLKLEPSQVAMAGDNPQDMEMARRAKAGLCVAVLSGNGKPNNLNPLADFVLNDISELPDLLGIST